MINIIQTTTELAMHIASAYIKKGDVLIDATCGNGHDTLRLALTEPSELLAFDIQKQAIENTEALLISNNLKSYIDDGTIRLICDSHENMDMYVKEKASVIMFNLGYLPGSDKTATTCKGSTLTAVSKALELLKTDGLICITMYSGHDKGLAEKQALLSFAENLDSHKYHTAYINISNQKNNPPEILLITRKN